ncbi:MAG: hypothetical protein KF760_28690 [Candidatus Eremiobacteraeota bacterium]|nr:hypothetical protein [Candidatus Eremiobacteraeota bacterium]MCW5865874.1 hypothetical protein [Candidatus Eremiobacteraeota bacterium]
MSDLQVEMETSLAGLKAVGHRADELHMRATSLRQRVEQDQAAFVARSKNVIPQAEVLTDRIRKAQEQLRAAFDGLTIRVKNHRQGLDDLQSRCSQETSQLYMTVQSLQIEHDGLTGAAQDLHQQTNETVFQHATQVETNLQGIAPGLENLDAHLRETVLPSVYQTTQEVVRLSNTIGQQIHQNVVPQLAQHSQALKGRMQQGSDEVSKQAVKLARDLDNKSRELMAAAQKAAQDVHDRSNARFLRLVGELQLTGTAIGNLITSANKALRGLHSMQRKAMGVLETIVSIVDSLLELLDRICQGVKIA